MKLIILFLFFSFTCLLSGQQVVTTAGGNLTGTGGNVSYSVGQVVYSTISGTTGTAVQGVQQPYEISVITALKEAEGIVLDCNIYPNPSAGLLFLKIEKYETEDIYYQLFDYNGTTLQKRKTEGPETQIRMEDQPPGIYFLKVSRGGKEVKTFKIIKN